MEKKIAKFLICPVTKQNLKLISFSEYDNEVIDGILVSEDKSTWYPIHNGIPRMLPAELWDRSEFKTLNKDKLSSQDLADDVEPNKDSLSSLKKHTIKNFGFEWMEYDRFGWDDPDYSLERERGILIKKSASTPDEFKDKLVLDGGCGNGRYSYWASEFGAEVIGVDLGDGVESAYKNCKDSNVNIIQADLFNLPFRENSFDKIFSIGVLMHTGNAKKATQNLVNYLTPNGDITVHVYGKGNPLYEMLDKLIRFFTIKMNLENLMNFTKIMASVASFADRIHILKILNLFIRLENHPHFIFDWYAAPIATHHKKKEVESWLQGDHMNILVSETTGGKKGKFGRLFGLPAFTAGGTVRVKARKIMKG